MLYCLYFNYQYITTYSYLDSVNTVPIEFDIIYLLGFLLIYLFVS